jgi:protein-S-isoprenylcysteine O-methyltransferase Ste14
VRRDQYLKSLLYVSFGIGTLVLFLPWVLRKLGVEWAAFDPGTLRWMGAVVMAIGAAMYFSCVWDFNTTGKGTPAFWDPPRRLITNPWFQAVRNPMYMGVALMNMGQGIFFGSTMILLYSLMVTLGFHVFVVAYEEPHLKKVYGADYDAYCQAVPRWFPRAVRARECKIVSPHTTDCL